MNKKVLIISYYFPPLGGAGIQRVAKFCKYLPSFGWDPVILTVKDIEYLARDESLEEEIPEEVKVFRSGSFDPLRILFLFKKIFRKRSSKSDEANKKPYLTHTKERVKFLSWFFFPDNKIGWLPWALVKGYTLCKKENIDLIFSTSPPPTAHLTAYFLKFLTRKSWIADFRDLWVGYQYQFYPTFLHRFLKKRAEKLILNSVKGIVAVNKRIEKRIKEKNPRSENLVTIPNGFDPDDFVSPGRGDPTDRPYQVVYMGTFNPDTNPEPFFKAWSNLLIKKELPEDKMKLIHLGLSIGLDLDGLIRKYDLSGMIERRGYLPHRDALKILTQADLLLLVVSEARDTELISTGKIYEYLYAQKPILAMVPQDGVAASLIKQFNAGQTIAPNDIIGIERALKSCYAELESWRGRINATPPIYAKDLEFFDRKYLTSNLAEFLNKIAEDK
jgi:glycosyltransferase involved in cell wall biosynthesis